MKRISGRYTINFDAFWANFKTADVTIAMAVKTRVAAVFFKSSYQGISVIPLNQEHGLPVTTTGIAFGDQGEVPVYRDAFS